MSQQTCHMCAAEHKHGLGGACCCRAMLACIIVSCPGSAVKHSNAIPSLLDPTHPRQYIGACVDKEDWWEIPMDVCMQWERVAAELGGSRTASQCLAQHLRRSRLNAPAKWQGETRGGGCWYQRCSA